MHKPDIICVNMTFTAFKSAVNATTILYLQMITDLANTKLF